MTTKRLPITQPRSNYRNPSSPVLIYAMMIVVILVGLAVIAGIAIASTPRTPYEAAEKTEIKVNGLHGVCSTSFADNGNAIAMCTTNADLFGLCASHATTKEAYGNCVLEFQQNLCKVSEFAGIIRGDDEYNLCIGNAQVSANQSMSQMN